MSYTVLFPTLERVKPRYRCIHGEAEEICLYDRTILRYDKKNTRRKEEVETSVKRWRNEEIKGERVGVGEYRVGYVSHYKTKSSNCWKGIWNSLKLTTHEVRQPI